MSGFLFSLLAFVIALSPLVFIHELGHYLMARACGVRVESFSIGFGPQIMGWTDKAGTRWKISLFLLGGYVKMAGDENVASTVLSEKEKDSSTFHSKEPWQKILIAIAGPFANYLTAFIILCSMFVVVGQPDYNSVVGQVAPGSIADKSGLRQGDRIVKIQDQPISRFSELLSVLEATPLSQRLHLKVNDTTTEKDFFISAPFAEGVWKGKLGIVPDPSSRVFSPIPASQATQSVLQMMNPIKMVKSLSMESMGGPIAIGHQAGQVLKDGWVSFMLFMGMISIALGFFNLLPIPLLDGGMVLFSLIEMIIRRPLSARVQQVISFVAFFILGGLFVFLSFKDLSRIPKVYQLMKALGLVS